MPLAVATSLLICLMSGVAFCVCFRIPQRLGIGFYWKILKHRLVDLGFTAKALTDLSYRSCLAAVAKAVGKPRTPKALPLGGYTGAALGSSLAGAANTSRVSLS